MCLQLVGEYLLYRADGKTAETLHTVSCRLLLDIMPGLETSVIFQDNVCSSGTNYWGHILETFYEDLRQISFPRKGSTY